MNAGASRWRDLLALALPALEYVFGSKGSTEDPDWTLGGGTAIAIALDHRVSFDIDIFLQRGRLKAFIPAENPASRLISDRFQWPGHYLKFERPEGEVDFLSAVLQTDPGFRVQEIDGHQVAVELPEEVIVKKIRFRSERFTARDAFDLAAVAKTKSDLAAILAREVPDALPRLSESLRILEARGPEPLIKAIVPTVFGSALIPEVYEVAKTVVADSLRLAHID